MSERDKNKTAWLFWTIIAVPLLLVLYVLSIGPAAWLVHNVPLPRPIYHSLEAVYFPLTWTAEHSPRCEEYLRWYVMRFIDPLKPPVNRP